VPVRAGRGVAEELDELLLDVGGDRVLPPVGLTVDLLPLEADDVEQEALREPVAAHDRDRERPAGLGEAQRPVVTQLRVALLDEAVDLLGDGGRRQSEPLDETGADRDDPLLLDLEDRLEVLLGRVVHLGQRRTSFPELRAPSVFPIAQICTASMHSSVARPTAKPRNRPHTIMSSCPSLNPTFASWSTT